MSPQPFVNLMKLRKEFIGINNFDLNPLVPEAQYSKYWVTVDLIDTFSNFIIRFRLLTKNGHYNGLRSQSVGADT